MIKHIVMWRFKENAEGKSKSENIQIVKKKLEELIGVIPQIREGEFEVGVNINNESPTAYDAVLVSTFNTWDDLQAYRSDPRHKKAAAYNKLVRSDRVVVDYELPGD